MISFYSVTKKFNKEVALHDISFDIKKGEFVFLAGVSGSGKSTLLRMLCREVKPTEGSLHMFGKRVNKINPKKLRRRMGIVFQDYKLLNNKTVLENVSYPLACLGMNPLKVKKKALEAIDKLHMGEFKNKMPEELSGGQQQRVAIARAIVTKPEILICDEPTGNLDMEHTWGIMKHLEALNKEGTTVVMTTHNEEVLQKMNKRIIRLHLGELIEDTGDEKNSNEAGVNEEPLLKKIDRVNPGDKNVLSEDESAVILKGSFSPVNFSSALDSNALTKKEKEMSILKELGWTEEDETRFRTRRNNQKRQLEGGQ